MYSSSVGRGFHSTVHAPPACTWVFHTKWPFLSIFNFEINHEISINFNEILETAEREQQRRRSQTYVPSIGRRTPESVRIAHVRLPRNTNVWAFSRAEMLSMMGTFGHQAQLEMSRVSAPSEWFVWGAVPDEYVQNRHSL